jgi:methylglutamate dehydrogenase subunit A
MSRYSILSLLRNAFSHHENWPRAWRSPDPKPAYAVVIIGGGGHGLATAYYLAKEHGITDVAVLERGWLGGGNTGRNTTIVRSDYYLEPNAHFYEHSLRLWEGLSQELNFNVMHSQRGFIQTAHDDPQVDAFHRRGNAMRLNGIDAVWLSREEVMRRAPILNFAPDARYPIRGALMQPRAGVARHDAVAWGYARAADARGVDIIQNCEVTGIVREGGRVTAVETTRGRIGAGKIGIAVAGYTSHVGAMAGLRLPIESHLLQAMVTEPVKPVIDTVIRYSAVHVYISQTDKGELLLGGELDGYPSYSQRGNLPQIEHVIAAAIDIVPLVSRLRLMRTWAGVMDMTMDGSPIIAKTPIEGLYLDGGWCYGGFKATPASGWCFAHTIAQDRPHRLNEAFTLERFAAGRVIDETGRGPTPGAH